MSQNQTVEEVAGALSETQRSPHISRHSYFQFPRLTGFLNSAGTLVIFTLMFLICADVISRAAFDLVNWLTEDTAWFPALAEGNGLLTWIIGEVGPIRGVTELVGYFLVAAVYLQLANTLHFGRFTRAELLIDHLDQKRPIAAAIYHIFFSLVGAAVFATIAWGTVSKVQEAWPDLVFGVANDFTILVWPLRVIILVGSFLVFLEFLFQGLDAIKRLRQAVRPTEAGKEKLPAGWGHVIFMAVAVALVLFIGQMNNLGLAELSRIQIGILSFVGMIILIYFGMHIGVALITLGFLGIILMGLPPRIAVNSLKLASNEFLRDEVFGAVPLFILMGLLVNQSDVGRDTFKAAAWMLQKLKGGLGVATVMANSIFAAITGSSIASAAVFTKIATPNMIDQGYTPRFSVGAVAGSSVLGVLIPPSLLLIVYGFVTEQSVGTLFIAAVIPGIILAGAMGLAIVGMAYTMPKFVGQPRQEDIQDENLFSALYKLSPIVLLIFAVMGGIYGGLFTPVEAGAVGSALALILAILRRKLNFSSLWKVLIETGHITVSVLFLILAARIYSQMLTFSGLPQGMGELISGAALGYLGFMALYVIVLIILGMFLDSISIMLVILPLVLPIAEQLGVDLIAFGIITVVGLEMGLLTPPLGLCVYVVKSTLDDARITLAEIFIGAAPFVVIMLFVVTLLILVPGLGNMDPADPIKGLINLIGSLIPK